MKHLQLLPFLFFAFIYAVSAQTDNQVTCSFEHKAGSVPLTLNQTVFSIWNNKKVILTRAEFYISELEIKNEDGSTTPLTDQYILVNANAPTAEYAIGAWPVQAAHGLVLHLGVPTAVNHNDPTAWPAGHPLAPQDPTMHWGWSAGYRFMAIEGKIDNNGDGVPETLFEFHNLGDALYKTVELTGEQNAANGQLQLHLVLDYIQLFKNMAMSGNLIQHGSAAINNTMMTNAATEGFLKMAAVSAVQQVESNSLRVHPAPNPADAEMLISYDLPQTTGLTAVVNNSLGQTVRSMGTLPANGTIRLETAQLPAGVYQCLFLENTAVIARKQVIIKH